MVGNQTNYETNSGKFVFDVLAGRPGSLKYFVNGPLLGS